MMHRILPIALVAVVGLAASVTSAGPHRAIRRTAPAAVPTPDAIVTLSNNISGDGRLVVNPDDFGAWTNWSNPLNVDQYDPAGPFGVDSPMFASSVFFYAGGIGGDRCVLAGPGDLTSTYPNSAGLNLTLTSPNVASDSDGDGVNDTSNSAFTITGGQGNFNLSVTLKQRVYKPASGSSVARFQQIYTITNNSTAPANFKFIKQMDADLMWVPPWEDVAGSVNTGGVINVYQREPGGAPASDPTAMAIVSPTSGYAYYAGRSGFDPDGGGPDPAMGYGTDFQIWNNWGLPTSWVNYTAGIGHAPTVGELPQQQPPGGAAPHDGFAGLEWVVSLGPSLVKVIEVSTVYGTHTAPPSPCYPDCNGDGLLNLADFGCFQTRFATGNMYADCNQDQVLNLADFGCFQTKFALGCP
jgi:hypothetical protein